MARPKRLYLRSSSFGVAMLFTLLLGLAAGGLGWLAYSFTRANLIRETEAAIDTEIATLDEWYDAEGMPALRRILAAREARDSRSFDLLLDAKGEKAAGNLPHLPDSATSLSEGLITFEWPVPGNTPLTLAAKIHTFPDGEHLLVGRNIDALIAAHRRIEWLGVAMVILMALVVLVSFLISGLVVRRINLIAQTAQRIIETDDLSQRIAFTAQWDDLGHLARILDQLFARIEKLMGSLRQVSENIAHDLRTPLTRLRNGLEDLGRDASDAQKPQIAALTAETDQLLATFASLLRIARIESGLVLAMEAIALETLMADAYELYEPLAEAKGIALRLATCPAVIQGDGDLLFQAFANLLDNAIKFTPEGGHVAFRCALTAGGATVVIEDSGPGIPQAEQAKVFERFYRGDRSRRTPGNGLGLSLAAAILAAHGADIRLEDASPGLRVILVFDTG